MKHDVGVFDTLCYYLAAEDRHRYVLELLRLGDPGPSNLNPAWRGLVLRNVVQALLRTVRQRSADAVLDVFFEVQSETWNKLKSRRQSQSLSKAPSDRYENLSLWLAACESNKWLTSGSLDETAREKYIRFMNVHRSNARTKDCNRPWAYACLALHVPGASDPNPALDYLREQFSDSLLPATSAGHVPFLDEVSRAHLFAIISDLAGILRHQDRMSDAQWAEQ